MAEFETVRAEEIKFGRNNFIEIARKKVITDSGENEFISIGRGFYLPDKETFFEYLKSNKIETTEMCGELVSGDGGCIPAVCDQFLDYDIAVKPLPECSFPLKPQHPGDKYYSGKTLGREDMTISYTLWKGI